MGRERERERERWGRGEGESELEEVQEVTLPSLSRILPWIAATDGSRRQDRQTMTALSDHDQHLFTQCLLRTHNDQPLSD